MVRRGDRDDVHVLLVENAAIIFGDVFLIVGIETTALGGGIEPLTLIGLGPAVEALLEIAVPHVARGDRPDALLFVHHAENDIDMLLTTSTNANEADA